jgi:fumarylacetoacetate (FAA) hydrolase
MKLATLDNGSPDGELVVVSRDLKWATSARSIARNLQEALERWTDVERPLRALGGALSESSVSRFAFEPWTACAPLPRAWQWLDGSAFKSHGDLMATVFGMEKLPYERPLMYQGMSHIFLSGYEDVPVVSEDDGIDFEGEFGVITDRVPMSTQASDAQGRIKLVVLVNDWSLRVLAPIEMKTGFGWIQAKPACSMAPVAVTPDELGPHWKNGRVALPLHVDWNKQPFGRPNGAEMAFSFPDLVAHAARTRELCAGTIIGSGTVSNETYRETGSSCIAERRGIETLDYGKPRTSFMQFGDEVRMHVESGDGSSLFGEIQQRVVRAPI